MDLMMRHEYNKEKSMGRCNNTVHQSAWPALWLTHSYAVSNPSIKCRPSFSRGSRVIYQVVRGEVEGVADLCL